LGARLSKSLPEKHVRSTLAMTLTLVGIKLVS